MQIAYLILAYEQPNHLARLVRALNDNGVYFLIHIDKKSDINDFRDLIRSRNVLFIPNRIKVYWGGYSQVAATINLLQTATDLDLKFDRYCRLSGADFPIKSNSYIKEFFESNSDKEFIRIDSRLDVSPRSPFCDNIERYHFLDIPWLNPQTTKLQLGRIIVKHALKILPRRKFIGTIPCHGSSWWCLTHQCVEYVLNFIKNNPEW